MPRRKITLKYDNVDADKKAAYLYSGTGLKLTTIKDHRDSTIVVQLRSDISRHLEYPLSQLFDTIFADPANPFNYEQFYFCRPAPLDEIDLNIIIPLSPKTAERITMTYNDMYSILQYLAMFFGFVYGISHPAFECYPINKYELGLVNGGIYLNCAKSKCNQRLTDAAVALDDRYIGTCASATFANNINIVNAKLPINISQNVNTK